MPEENDRALLRAYADGGSESAFAQLVQRHINLVYSVALRFTGNAADAQDVTQAVFVILARKATGLRPQIILSGWLYETTRFTAMNFLTQTNRRHVREQEAYLQSAVAAAESEDLWSQFAPLLEEAMARLSEKDRTLMVLRFFENKSIAETAALAGLNEWAARKRVARALEKLRGYFARCGIESTTATLVGAISAHSVHAAPAALAPATVLAVGPGDTVSTSTLTLAKGALKVMAWTKAKMALGVGIAAVLIAGTTVTWVVWHSSGRTDFPRSSWENAGYADPVAAFETTFWATSRSDGQTLLASLTPDLQRNLEQGLKRAGIAPENFLSDPKNSAAHLDGVTGYHIVKTETVSADEVRLHLAIEGKPAEQVFTMKRIGAAWKMDGFPSGF